MSIATTGIMKQQLMKTPLDTTPEAGMEGGVNRPSIVADLMTAMKDLDFRQLMEQYAAMSGENTSISTPLTAQMMQEEQQGNFQTGGDVMQGESNMPVINPNQMPSLQGTYSNMPVLPGNPNPPGIDKEDIMKQNMGLMQPIDI